MTPQQAFRAIAKRRSAFKGAVMEAEEMTRKEALKAADRQSSGPYSQAELTKAGHPFATRAPNSAFDPATINKGKGVFRRSWQSSGPQYSGSNGGTVITKIWNNDHAAKYLLGTKKMIERPVRQAILQAVTPGRLKRLREARDKAIKG